MIHKAVTWFIPSDALDYVEFVRGKIQKRSKTPISQSDAAKWIIKSSMKANAMVFRSATKGRPTKQQLEALMD